MATHCATPELLIGPRADLAGAPARRASRRDRDGARPALARLVRAGRAQVREHGQHAPVIVVSGGQVQFREDVQTCFSTAPSVTTSSRAIAAFVRPWAISSSVSRSRGGQRPELGVGSAAVAVARSAR